jgi:hypothetical protein
MSRRALARNLPSVVLFAMLLAACSCSQTLKLMKDDSATVLAQQTISAPNPADKGAFAVKTLFYGSGTDKQRPEYGKDVTIKTKTVDASPFATSSRRRRIGILLRSQESAH